MANTSPLDQATVEDANLLPFVRDADRRTATTTETNPMTDSHVLSDESGLRFRREIRFFGTERTVDESGDESGLRVGVSSSSTILVAVLVHRFSHVLSDKSGLRFRGEIRFFGV